MALTGIVPPGTISVVPSLRTVTNLTNVRTFDWNNQGTEGLLIQDKQGNTTIYYPRAPVMGIASITSQTKTVLKVPNPGSNSSYKMQFYGPAFKCNAANSSQQTAFDYYSLRSLEENDQVIVQQYQNNYTTFQPGNSKLRIWSAFSPQLFGFITNDFGFPNPDHYSNFYAQLPPDTAYRGIWGGAHLWVQLSNQSIVCQLTNASFTVGFDYPNGAQDIISRTVEHLNIWTPHPNGSDYLGYMAALTPMLNGNMSMLPFTCNDSSNQPSVCLMQTAASSQILQTSIAACPEIWNNWWYNNIKFFGINPILPQPAINCRNGSVMAALEDLAANMTISLLSFNLSDSLKLIPLFP